MFYLAKTNTVKSRLLSLITTVSIETQYEVSFCILLLIYCTILRQFNTDFTDSVMSI
jgi:hypothetical protein